MKARNGMRSGLRRSKPARLRAVKKCFSLPSFLYDRAAEQAEASGFSTFSDYLQDVLKRELHSHGPTALA